MANRAHKTRARSKPKRINKTERHHYWPYLPMLFMLFAIFFTAFLQPRFDIGVLAYATEMSQDQLLAATNERRQENGKSPLKINNLLNSSAQAKAQDMVSKNYWSHNSPDGEEPWIFFADAGYKYIKAGENLAYGFSTSDSTVTGWMNSTTHRDNMLDSNFTEVGFGYVNGSDFNHSGKETVVVAHYGKPQTHSASAGSSKPSQKKSASQPKENPQPKTVVNSKETKQTSKESTPVTSDKEIIVEPESHPVARVQVLGDFNNNWRFLAIGIITGGLTAFLLVKHAVRIRHLIRDSEKFVLHHPVLDMIVLSVILVGTYLLQTSGFVR